MRVERRHAFTLIEISAVLVLIGLMATAAALSLRSAYRGAQMEDVINRVRALDQSARRLAEVAGRPGVVRIDRAAGRMSFTQSDDAYSVLHPVRFPAGYRITDVRLASQAEGARDAEIRYTAHGRSPTYALSLAGPNEQSRLLIFAGLTGQLTVLEHDEVLDLDNLLTPRPDAY